MSAPNIGLIDTSELCSTWNIGSKGFKPVSCLLIVPCVKDKEGNMECLDTMKDIESALKATGQGEEVMDELAKLFYELLREG